MKARIKIDPKLLPTVRKAAEAALDDGIEYLGEESERTIPIEEGTMARTGQASGNGLVRAWSYGTKYAVRQHEDTRLNHDSGRRAKWAERTWMEQLPRVGQFLADRMRRALP